MSSDARSPRVDVPTLIAISALAYTLANIVHEGLGHGGTCVLVGARPMVLNAIFFEYDEHAASLVQQRWISAGGSIANALVGFAVLGVLRRGRLPTSSRYFLWLFAAVNLLTAFGYLLYSGIGGIGDWSRVVQGLGSPWLLRGGMAIVGAVLYFVVAPRLLMPPLDPFLGTDPAVRAARARMLCLMPYLAGGVSLVVAGILNPYGLRVVLISAVAAAFGGTSLLAWYPGTPRTPFAGTPAVPLAIERSWAWIAAGAVVLTFFVIVLGPGLRLG
jgi:hypothetical protein